MGNSIGEQFEPLGGSYVVNSLPWLHNERVYDMGSNSDYLMGVGHLNLGHFLLFAAS